MRAGARVVSPRGPVYTGATIEVHGAGMTWSSEVFWRIFESTGSIWAYLAYRRLLRGLVAELSLN